MTTCARSGRNSAARRWSRSGPGSTRCSRFEDEYLADVNGFTKATQLRDPISFGGGKVRDAPVEVTDGRVRYWMKLQLQCSDEQMAELGFDSSCEVWMAVVETAEGLRVGGTGARVRTEMRRLSP